MNSFRLPRILSTLVLLGVLAIPMMAKARTADDIMCKYNAAKFLPAFKAAVISFLSSNIKFEWNQASLKISCAKDTTTFLDAKSCAVVFKAKDGTVFYLRDSPQCSTDEWGHSHCSDTSDYTMSNITLLKEQRTDDEGNYTGPITCTASLYDPWIINKKSNVFLMTPNPKFPEVSYQQ
jgi:hypothetical protein